MVIPDPAQSPSSTAPGPSVKSRGTTDAARPLAGRARHRQERGGKRGVGKVAGATRQEVIDKLNAARIELAKRIRPKAGYTVAHAVRDWLNSGLPGPSAKTVSTYREVTDPLLAVIGGKLLTELTGDQVRAALVQLGRTRSTR